MVGETDFTARPTPVALQGESSSADSVSSETCARGPGLMES
jgi:hypothetical protein